MSAKQNLVKDLSEVAWLVSYIKIYMSPHLASAQKFYCIRMEKHDPSVDATGLTPRVIIGACAAEEKATIYPTAMLVDMAA